MDTGIRPAGPWDIPALVQIWRACFCDPEDYIRYFYSENFAHIAVPVFTVNDTPVSMLHLLDAVLADGKESRAAKLVYAAGTLPAYRQSGYMGALVRHVTARARQEAHALFLKPASPYLADFYKAFGFEPDAYLRLVTLTPGEKRPLAVSPLSPEAYNRMRNGVFSARPYARWPDRHIEWCVADHTYFGGGIFTVRLNGEDRFFMGAPQEGAFLITETDLSFPELRMVSGSLCALFGTEVLKAYLPEDACEAGEKIVASVVFNAPLCDQYINLILI